MIERDRPAMLIETLTTRCAAGTETTAALRRRRCARHAQHVVRPKIKERAGVCPAPFNHPEDRASSLRPAPLYMGASMPQGPLRNYF
jgi:hypothetical protein